jgi:hypothetical protein
MKYGRDKGLSLLVPTISPEDTLKAQSAPIMAFLV